ncbi:MAG: LysM peptidoglycan-binding domain-containing protein [Patescibacteria group bacterium]|nr:LysM peptidoglycan-binding domain-containing protein [Patescibacteria group bacterium]
MKKKYYKNISYKKLLFSIIKEKYFELFLGMFFSFMISFYTYKFFLKNINLNLKFSLPKISFNNKLSKKIENKKSTNQQKIYIVQPGDDLWHIAEKFYGSGFNAYDIAVANNFDPSAPISEGQKLIIPSVKPRQLTKGETSSAQANFNKTKYIVQPGDSLSIISLKFYGSLYAWPKILEANKLISPDNIEVGTELIIP